MGPVIQGDRYVPDQEQPDPDTDTDSAEHCTVDDLLLSVAVMNFQGRECSVCGSGGLSYEARVENPCSVPITYQARSSCLVDDLYVTFANELRFPETFFCDASMTEVTVQPGEVLSERFEDYQVEEGALTVWVSFTLPNKPLVGREFTVVGPDYN